MVKILQDSGDHIGLGLLWCPNFFHARAVFNTEETVHMERWVHIGSWEVIAWIKFTCKLQMMYSW